jgi:hypothetical protein
MTGASETTKPLGALSGTVREIDDPETWKMSELVSKAKQELKEFQQENKEEEEEEEEEPKQQHTINNDSLEYESIEKSATPLTL